jgi:hypothetical protein
MIAADRRMNIEPRAPLLRTRLRFADDRVWGIGSAASGTERATSATRQTVWSLGVKRASTRLHGLTQRREETLGVLVPIDVDLA